MTRLIITIICLLAVSCGGDDDDQTVTPSQSSDDDDDDDTGGDDDGFSPPPGDDDDDADDDADDDDAQEEKTWTDPTSGLTWHAYTLLNDAYPDESYDEAIDMCTSLVFAGFDDWHLPTISEFRTLIRGCPQTETGGACRIVDECIECNKLICGCHEEDAPNNGCYWPIEINEIDILNRCGNYWSSSSVPDNPGFSWFALFQAGGIRSIGDGQRFNVRCVR